MNIITLEADARKYFILQRLKPILATSGGSSLQSLALLPVCYAFIGVTFYLVQ